MWNSRQDSCFERNYEDFNHGKRKMVKAFDKRTEEILPWVIRKAGEVVDPSTGFNLNNFLKKKNSKVQGHRQNPKPKTSQKSKTLGVTEEVNEHVLI